MAPRSAFLEYFKSRHLPHAPWTILNHVSSPDFLVITFRMALSPRQYASIASCSSVAILSGSLNHMCNSPESDKITADLAQLGRNSYTIRLDFSCYKWLDTNFTGSSNATTIKRPPNTSNSTEAIRLNASAYPNSMSRESSRFPLPPPTHRCLFSHLRSRSNTDTSRATSQTPNKTSTRLKFEPDHSWKRHDQSSHSDQLQDQHGQQDQNSGYH